MSQANIFEQFMLELINAERIKVGAQPLAFDKDLNQSAEKHSDWMIATDTFSHTGEGGSNPGDRMTSAGYDFTGSWAWAENIAWMSTRSPTGFKDEVQQLHEMLMNSSGHRTNLLNDTFREVGIGFEVGQYGNYEGAFVTQNFAQTQSDSFLTGVAYDDKDDDRHYDIGEGLGGLTVNIKNNATGEIMTTNTNPAGGYELELPSGTYTVSFLGSEFATISMQTTIDNKNVKLDLIDPVIDNDSFSSDSQSVTQPTPESQLTTMSGTAHSDTLFGTSANDVILGFDGRDKLFGAAGNDLIDGGSGRDKLWGGSGADILTGGTGRDSFIFDAPFLGAVDKITDFSPPDDIIRLENTIFIGLDRGRLDASTFHIGTEAHDSNDNIIYNSETGALYFDVDAAGGADAQQFAQLTPELLLSHFDFYII